MMLKDFDGCDGRHEYLRASTSPSRAARSRANLGHCHLPVMPRRAADIANPRGGVRATIPGKGDYTT